MVHIGVSLVSIIIELIQLFASKDLQFVFKILIVFCLLGKKWGGCHSKADSYFQCNWHIQSVCIDTSTFIRKNIHWKWITWCHKATLSVPTGVATLVAIMALDKTPSSMWYIPLLDNHKWSTVIPSLRQITTLVNAQLTNHQHTVKPVHINRSS